MAESPTATTRRGAFLTAGAGMAWAAAGSASAAPAARGPAVRPHPPRLTTPPEAILPTAAGRVRGFRNGGIYTFRGVPYGGSTAGQNRFMPPTPPKPWSDVRLALGWGDTCPQAPETRRQTVIDWVSEEDNSFQSEDCLNLNVWTPALDAGAKLPVLVWLHGGGYQTGSSREHPGYDGTNLARRNAVVVSVNHRLGVLGFMDLSTAGDRFEASGNVGMLDIVQALKWVQEHIARFGGDPSRVTIFGQSGGGGKVSTLMGMPAARGLFDRAVVMSGSFPGAMAPAEAQKAAQLVADAAGQDLAGLQKLEVQALVAAGVKAGGRGGPPGAGPPGVRWGPVLDGRHYTQAWTATAPAMSSDIPLMVGNCRDEFRDPNMAVDEARLQTIAGQRFGERGTAAIADLRATLPGVSTSDVAAAFNALSWRNMALDQVRKHAALGGAPAYSYWYVWPAPLLDGRIGVPHGADLIPFFDNIEAEPAMTANHPEAFRLGQLMSTALVNFAATGKPDQPGLAWPAFNPADAPTMVFGSRTRVVNDPAGVARKIAASAGGRP